MADGFFPRNLLVLIKFVNGLVEGHDFLFPGSARRHREFRLFPLFYQLLDEW